MLEESEDNPSQSATMDRNITDVDTHCLQEKHRRHSRKFEKRNTMDIEEIYKHLGRPGLYQGVIVGLLCLNYIPIVNNHLAMIFYGLKGQYSCSGNTTLNTSELCGNVTVCEDILWKEGPHFSVVSEFELICTNEHLKNLSTTVYFVGVMLGGLLFGTLSDIWGRKKVMILTMVLTGGLGAGIALSWSFLAFTVMRFFQGAVVQGLQTSTYTLIMELVQIDLRAAAGASAEVVWGVGVLWLAVLAWMLKQWNYIQWAISLPVVLFALPYLFIVPDSLRWLLINGRKREARSWIKRAARINRLNKETTLEILASVDDQELHVLTNIDKPQTRTENGTKTDETCDNLQSYETDEKYSQPDNASKSESIKQEANVKEKSQEDCDLRGRGRLAMCCKKQMSIRFFILSFTWFSVSLGYYGISFALPSLGGNIYLTVFIGGCLEIIAYISSIFAMGKIGRRLSLAAYLILAAAFCFTAAFCPEDVTVVRSIMASLGRFGFAGTFCITFVYTSELFPTPIRNMALGICVSFTRVGGMLAPLLPLIGSWSIASVPLLVCGILASTSGFLPFFLPETLNKPLPDSLKQATDVPQQIKDTKKISV